MPHEEKKVAAIQRLLSLYIRSVLFVTFLQKKNMGNFMMLLLPSIL